MIIIQSLQREAMQYIFQSSASYLTINYLQAMQDLAKKQKFPARIKFKEHAMLETN